MAMASRAVYKRMILGSSVDDNPARDDDDDDVGMDIVDPSIREDAEALFENFLQEQIRSDDLLEPSIKMIFGGRARDRMSKTELADLASRLCHVAASFAQSEERKALKRIALEVNPRIASHDLATVLISLVSQSPHFEEGLVVMFYFCLDLAVRVLESGLGDLGELLSRCKDGLVRALAPRVMARGGWAKVLTMAASKRTGYMGLIAAGAMVCFKLAPGMLLFL